MNVVYCVSMQTLTYANFLMCFCDYLITNLTYIYIIVLLHYASKNDVWYCQYLVVNDLKYLSHK